MRTSGSTSEHSELERRSGSLSYIPVLRDIYTSLYFSDGGPQGERVARVILVRQPSKKARRQAGFLLADQDENLRFDQRA
jgi:hypothetical protein